MNQEQTSSFARLTWSVYGLPIVLSVLAVIPMVNEILFGGHGGPGLFLLLLSLPLAFFKLWLLSRQTPVEGKARLRRFRNVSLAAYGPVTFLAAALGAKSLDPSGTFFTVLDFWPWFIFPFSLLGMGFK